ncbi:MAG: RNA polymerase factor sigma-54 [Bauldia sp.]|nr:RNA polymerase factor sigma-54 [Bauldia sp.]MCW5717678.1 RNA polymerase factor sigma-54 [Bauldia sp.]
MALSLKAELRTSQSLVMTPQLMQAIKLLQLSSLDLAAYVDAELERNPLLERVDADDAGPLVADERGDDRADIAGAHDGSDGGEETWVDTEFANAPQAIAEKLDSDLSNVFQDDNPRALSDTAPALPVESWATAPSRQPVSSDDYNLEAFVAAGKTLPEFLTEQLGLATTDAQMRIVGVSLISELDEAGYLRTDPAELARRLGASTALVNRTLALLKGFEPTGVFAASLEECLALQLGERNRLDPAMQALLANLDLVAKRDYAGLRRLCGVDEADLSDMLAELRLLNPKPGAGFDHAPIQTLIPDVMVTPGPDGDWRIELNNETLPRLLVNHSYYATVSGASKKDTDRAFLAERFQTAKWLVDSLDRRARTILKVATEIVRQQDGFLAHGVAHLRPLNLKAVADAISMHESTVSRVTSNKYMATQRGIFELKYFFTSSIPAAGGGEAHSAEAVRHHIRTLIDGETDTALSDDTIVKLLRRQGIDIARRTVAKYRESMHIPSSVNRRRDRHANV